VFSTASCWNFEWVFSRAALVLAAGISPRPPRPPATPAGWWDTISDRDGRPTAVIEIREVNGEYQGIVRALLVAATAEDSVCGRCDGQLKGARVVGMTVLWGLKPDGHGWSGGEILDPENGKTYRAKMNLADNGAKLIVRGYIGWSLFGRSQTWVRRN
jgi:uncharacterized protein (DUF2147 family)